MKKKVLIPLLGCGGLVMGLGVFGLIIWFFVVNTKVEPLSPEEHSAMLTIEDLSQWSDFAIDESAITSNKTTTPDGSYELTYEYQPEDNSLYYQFMVTVEGSPGDAVLSYKAVLVGAKVGFNISDGDIKMENHDEWLEWGDESVNHLLVTADGNVGNMFAARKGKIVVYCVLSGLYFEEQFKDFILPALDDLEKHFAT